MSITAFALFGFWTLACVVTGMVLQYRRELNRPPVSFDPSAMFNWIKNGDPKPKPGEPPPPIEVEGVEPVNYSL